MLPQKKPPTSGLASTLIKHGVKPPKQAREPLWEGPHSRGDQGGITFSLLCRFLSCRERFRLYVVKGLKGKDRFAHRLEYGNMWHLCEEEYAAGRPFANPVMEYADKLAARYPLDREQVYHWAKVCLTQFPYYVGFWKQHPDTMNREPLLQERPFAVEYLLPSGRKVVLRGKWDSVDLLTDKQVKPTSSLVYIQENKTKGDIDEPQVRRQLVSGFDLQTMFYLVALQEFKSDAFWQRSHKKWRNEPIGGIRYNVVRRPLSGGKGTIRQHKGTSKKAAESSAEFYARLGAYIAEDPAHYFMRWKVDLCHADIERFKCECLHPILENLLDWWDEVQPPMKQARPEGYATPMSWRHPYGVWNPLDEGGSSELDEYLLTGSDQGLQRVTNLFPELNS